MKLDFASSFLVIKLILDRSTCSSSKKREQRRGPVLFRQVSASALRIEHPVAPQLSRRIHQANAVFETVADFVVGEIRYVLGRVVAMALTIALAGDGQMHSFGGKHRVRVSTGRVADGVMGHLPKPILVRQSEHHTNSLVAEESMQHPLFGNAWLEKLGQGEGRSGQLGELDDLLENALGLALTDVDESEPLQLAVQGYQLFLHTVLS